MSNRIQRANNRVNTAAVAIGYTPNKSLFSPLDSPLSGLNLDTSLVVRELTAATSFRTSQIYADTIVANVITTTTTLTGGTEGTFVNTLTAAETIVNNLNVRQYLYNDSTKVIPGTKFGESNKINFAFTHNNNVYIFGEDNTNTDYVKIYNIFNINTPQFILSSYEIAPIDTYKQFVLNKNTNHLYYASLNNRIFSYKLDTNTQPVSTTNIQLPIASDVEKLFIQNNYLYAQANNPSRLVIFDVSNPSTITFTGSCNLFGREIIGVYDNFVLTTLTTLTGGTYKELIGVIDTISKASPYRLNELPFNDVGYEYTQPKIYQNYIYRTHDNFALSSSRLYFYDAYDFVAKPFRPTLTHITSSALPGYENLGFKTFVNNRLYVTSTGQKNLQLNQYPKGFSVWNFSNIFQPISSYFWNDLENNRGPGKIFNSYQGTLITETSDLSSLQLFYTYGANFESLKAHSINSETFDTFKLNTENIEFINAVGTSITAINIESNDIVPVLPTPKISLEGVSTLTYGGDTGNQLSAGGQFLLERTPQLIQEDITQETLSKYDIFLEMVVFKKRRKMLSKSRPGSYTYTSPAQSNSSLWGGFFNRNGQDRSDYGAETLRTNYIPITAVGRKINLNPLLNLRLRERQIAYIPLTAQNNTDYNLVPLLCPFGGPNNSAQRLSQATPRYPYARAYKPLYVAFRYIAWLPKANNSKGQIISGPLSPVLRVSNKLFPFYTNHYESSIKGFPVASLSPYYNANFDIMKKTFTCKFC